MKLISTNKAAQAIGPYSQACKVDNWVFTSGQIPLTPEGELAGQGIEEQTHQVFKNLKAVLEEAGATFDQVVKVTVFIRDMDEFAKVNEVYATYFTNHKPARSTVEVARLPKDVKIEIEMVAYLG